VASVVVVLLLLGEGHVHVHRGHVMGTTAARVSSDRQTRLASEHTPSCLAFPPSLCNSSAYLLLIHFFTLTESYIPQKMKDLFVKEISRWKLDDSLLGNEECIYTVPQWCTNPRYQIA